MPSASPQELATAIFEVVKVPSFGTHDDSTITRDTVTVNLRFTVLAAVQATISLGLASINNNESAGSYS